jgi:hypothetical protein
MIARLSPIVAVNADCACAGGYDADVDVLNAFGRLIVASRAFVRRFESGAATHPRRCKQKPLQFA